MSVKQKHCTARGHTFIQSVGKLIIHRFDEDNRENKALRNALAYGKVLILLTEQSVDLFVRVKSAHNSRHTTVETQSSIKIVFDAHKHGPFFRVPVRVCACVAVCVRVCAHP